MVTDTMFKITYKKATTNEHKIVGNLGNMAFYSYQNNKMPHHIIFENCCECYMNSKGDYHRIDGPAVIFDDGAEWYCFEGELYSFEEWKNNVQNKIQKS